MTMITFGYNDDDDDNDVGCGSGADKRISLPVAAVLVEDGDDKTVLTMMIR